MIFFKPNTGTRIVCAISFGLVALSASVSLAQGSDTEYDRAGNPLVSEGGTRITYSPAQLGEALPLSPFELTGLPSAESAIASPTALTVVKFDSSKAAGSVHSSASAAATPEAAPSSSNLINLDRIWQHSIWGANLGESGIAAADLDGDGSTELVLGATLARDFGANRNWHIVKYHAENDSYEIVHTSDDNPDRFSNTAEINVVSVYEIGSQRRILIAYDNGTLAVFDGATRRLWRSIEVSSSEILSVAHGDGDNDGLDEVIVATENNTYLYNALTLAKESEISVGGRDLSVGNVDSDPFLEMVYVEGPVVQYDGSTAIQQWDFSGFSPGNWLELGDLDNDGVEELIVARRWYYIDILDAENRTPLRQITTSTNISQLKVVDVTGDAVPEVLYGDEQHGEVHAIDGVSLDQLWELDNPTSGAPGIEVADIDNDGDLEVIWGSGSNSTAPDFLSIHDIATLEREFINADEGGPFRGLAVGDTDADGEDEIVLLGGEAEAWGTGETRYQDTLALRVFNSLDLSPEWNSYDHFIPANHYAYRDVAIGDVDGVGASDIVVTHGYFSDLNINVIDGVLKSEVSSNRINADPANSIAMANFVGDEKMEIIATSGNQLHIIDPVSLTPIWSSIVLAGVSSASHIEAVDVYGDELPDIVASLGRILVIDGVTKIYRQSDEADYVGFAIAGESGSKEIIAGTQSGLLVSLDPDTFDRTEIGSVCAGPVNGVRVDASVAFAGTIQFACPDHIGIWGTTEQQVLWRSPSLGADVGVNNSLLTLEQDGEALLVVGTGYGAHAFRGPGASIRDADNDGLLNHFDNCPQDANANQEDLDGDGIGDVCNSAIDTDGDDWADALDNCSFVPHPGQEDTDNSGRGDACTFLPPGC
ncbi:MAG: hypothetical protein Hals2KO_28760 [Halioglobus sp.]